MTVLGYSIWIEKSKIKSAGESKLSLDIVFLPSPFVNIILSSNDAL